MQGKRFRCENNIDRSREVGCEEGLVPADVQWQVSVLAVLKCMILLPDSKMCSCPYPLQTRSHYFLFSEKGTVTDLFERLAKYDLFHIRTC
jgi:hypothetical protein